MSRSASIRDPAKKWILWGIPFISIAGSLMHFVYEWSGKLPFVGAFAPVNESIWEHLKLALWPSLIWWLAGYFICSRATRIPFRQWFFSYTVSMLVCPLFIITFYYTYTGVFGVHLLSLDIASLFIGVIIAQFTALHIYRYAKVGRALFAIAIAVFIMVITAFTIFTFTPPHIPVFLNSQNGKYGI